jgi:polar amino acid transport system substrate-binding protein
VSYPATVSLLIQVLFTVCLIVIFTPGKANPLDSRTLEIGTLDYPPYIHPGKDLTLVDGAATRIVRAVFDDMDQPVHIRIYPWARALTLLEEGKIDALFTAYKTKEREAFAIYSNEILFVQEISLFSLKDAIIPYVGHLTSVMDNAINTINTESYGKEFDQLRTQNAFSKLVAVGTAEQCLGMLVTKRVDLWVSNRLGAYFVAKQEQNGDVLHELTPPIDQEPSYIMFTKKKNLGRTRDRFDARLRAFKETGRYKAIVDDYLEEHLDLTGLPLNEGL